MFFGKASFFYCIEIRNAHQFSGYFLCRSHQVQLSFHRTLQHHIYRQHTIDLIGTFKDAVDAGIAIGSVHRRFGTIAHTTIDLYTFVRYIIQRFRSVYFDHGCFNGELFRSFQLGLRFVHAFCNISFGSIFDILAGTVCCRLTGIGTNGLLCQLILDRTVF
ncbi:hypothetical protein D9M68_800610 [compost metagenome]